MFLASFEPGVLECVLLVLLPSFMKVIHVQLNRDSEYLPDEGSIVRMPEMSGENVLRKFLDFLDNKALSIFGPADNVTVFRVLCCREIYL